MRRGERLQKLQIATLPLLLRMAWRRLGIPPTQNLLLADIGRQRLWWLRRDRHRAAATAAGWRTRGAFGISSSRHGTGQARNSLRTPLGLHRIARKIGGGYPPGAVWRHRQFAGYAWQGARPAAIVHRILWLEGLEPGFNRGGEVDSFARYIYLHGVGDEARLGQPASLGCLELRGNDIVALYDGIPLETQVYIAARI